MSKVRLVVVGNGMVGHRFIEELIERADPGRYEITVFGAENPVPPTIASISPPTSLITPAKISPSSNPASTTSTASACCSAKR